MNYRAMMRRKLLEQMYDKMSADEKRAFIQLSMQDKDHTEIMQSLRGISKQVQDGRHSFTSDLMANVSGNAIWDSLLWLGGKLIKKL